MWTSKRTRGERILAVHGQLKDTDHYALLGVERTADIKAIKRAYFDAAALFHPDRYFRKRLGSFKPRLEAIFSRITVALETLSDPDKRGEYDAYVGARERTRAIESLLSSAAVEAERIQTVALREAAIELQEAPIADALSHGPPQTPPSVAPPIVGASGRRDAFARRLLGGRTRTSTQPPTQSKTADSSPRPLSTADAMEALKQRYEQRVATVRLAHARQYVARGEASLASGDAVSAANALRVAVGLTPGNAESRAHGFRCAGARRGAASGCIRQAGRLRGEDRPVCRGGALVDAGV